MSIAVSLLLLLLPLGSQTFAQRRTASRVVAQPAPGAVPAKRKSPARRNTKMAVRQDGINSQGQPINEQEGYVGVPWTGEAGVQRTTGDIIEAQTNAPIASGRPLMKEERDGPNRKALPQDPDAEEVASTPVTTAAPIRSRGTLTPVDPTTTVAPQTVSTSFTGATLSETGAFPPDTMGAVGPSQFFVFLNGRMRTFNKTTGVADGVINVDPDVFFASIMTTVPVTGVNFTSDPNVRYDRLSNRWFLTIIDVPSSTVATIGDTPNRILIAVSDAASNGVITASTVWTFYFIQQDMVGNVVTNGEFLDYPSLGIDNNALYIGGNMFNAALGSFVNCTGFVIRKSSVLSGGPVVVTPFRGILPNGSADGPFSPRGVDNYDAAATEGFFIGVSNAAFGRLVMRRVSDPGGTPAISANILITTPSTSFPITVDHLGDTGGTNGNLDALDDRLYAAHIRNGRLWTAHNIAVLATGVSSGTNAARRNGVRWYELAVPPTTGTPTINQSGTIFDSAATVAAARQFFIPTVMVSGQGHAAFGFTTAGTPFRIDAATNGRLSGDALGTTGAFTAYTASSTAYNPPSDPGPPRRFGDYSFTSLDPEDDMTMWTIQEFCNATNSYGVRAVKLLAPPPATPLMSSPTGIPAGQTSVSVTITGNSVNGSGFFDPGPGFAKHITATVSGGVTVNSVTYTDPTHVTLDLNTTAATGGPKNVTITNPDGQSATGTGIITVAAPPSVGQVLITEFRFRGAAGAADEYVELYNNTNDAADISGFTLYALTGAGAQALRFTVPGAIGSNTTVIPARGHFLITGASYSLAGAAASNGTLSTGIVDTSSIGLFAGATPSAANRIDSVGFNTTDALFFEGTALTPSTGITVDGEYAFVRKQGTATGGFPQDSNNNAADFDFISTTGGTFSAKVSILGAPGPENLAAPINRSATFVPSLIEPNVGSSVAPNRVRVGTGNSGTLSIRRRYTNNSATVFTALRFRVIDVTTLNTPGYVLGGAQADVRPTTSSDESITATSIGVTTIKGTALSPIPTPGALGGGLNSTLTVALPGGGLGPGATIDLQFLLNVVQSGSFRFFINIEGLP